MNNIYSKTPKKCLTPNKSWIKVFPEYDTTLLMMRLYHPKIWKLLMTRLSKPPIFDTLILPLRFFQNFGHVTCFTFLTPNFMQIFRKI